MKHPTRWMVVILLILASIQLSACTQQLVKAGEPELPPVVVTPIDGTDLNLIVVTKRAAERLDIQTAPVREEQVNGAQSLVAPYAALIYGLHGDTWVYVNPEPLTFVREPITVDYIKGDLMVLLEGPAAGTEVATVAVAELYGIDTGVGK